jgi:CarD family transcriptional regulator
MQNTTQLGNPSTSSLKIPQFKVGDKAVYPAYGVGVIKRIESREIAGNSQDFYVMQILATGVTVMVPTSAAAAGMRRLIAETDVSSVYSILKSPGHISKTTWNRRFREFKDKLRTGSVRDVAEVLRDLNTLRTDKSLSFSEKEMMDKAKEMIVTEISAARATDHSSVEAEVNKILLLN